MSSSKQALRNRQARRKLINLLPDLILPIITTTYVLLAPYTKVEESFTLHGVHDFMSYGILNAEGRARWDHITFPGAVPRSFLPPVILGIISWPAARLGIRLGLIHTKLDVQIAVRPVLALIYSGTFGHLSKSIRSRYGPSTRYWFLVFSFSQFHLNFYAGRTLPNFMALPGVLLSVSLIIRSLSASLPTKIIKKRRRTAIILMTALATDVRLELALFLFPLVLSLVISGRVSLINATTAGMIGGFGSLAISAPLDYILWSPTIPHPSLPTFTSPSQIIWPELSAFTYNLLEGQASNWGVSPWYYYLANSLPKLLLGALPLIILGVGQLLWERLLSGRSGKRSKSSAMIQEILGLFGLGVAGLIGGMSVVEHKEWRFIVYVVPIFNLIAAITASSLWDTTYRRLRPLFRLGLVGILVANVAVTVVMTLLSIDNYPGGEVWKVLEKLEASSTEKHPVSIHLSSYPLQTGSSLFTFLHSPPPFDSSSPQVSNITNTSQLFTSALPPPLYPLWEYSKSEDPALLTPEGAKDAGFTYLVIEASEYAKYTWTQSLPEEGEDEVEKVEEDEWEIVGEVLGFEGVRRGGKWGLEVVRGRKILLLGNINRGSLAPS